MYDLRCELLKIPMYEVRCEFLNIPMYEPSWSVLKLGLLNFSTNKHITLMKH
jgi:hypothetical protein